MLDITEMKRRVAATEAKLKAASADGEARSQRLLDLLETVETNFSRKQQEIDSLKEQQAAAAEEVQQLRNLLQVTLTMAETSKIDGTGLSSGELESLIGRLSQVAESAPDAAIAAIAAEAPAPAEEPQPAPAGPAVKIGPPALREPAAGKPERRGKGLGRVFTIFAALTWLATAGLIAERF